MKSKAIHLPALWAAKLTQVGIALAHVGAGTTLPGRIATKLCPTVLAQLGAQLTVPALMVTGTNGKTTTTGLIAHALARHLEAHSANRAGVVSNVLGANMKNGVISALLAHTSLSGHLPAGIHPVLEVDEASLQGIIHDLPTSRLVVTNLFRDQLDRYGELATTAQMIESGIEASQCSDHDPTPAAQTALVLNADDPLVANMALLGKRVLCFGVDSVQYGDVNHELPPLTVPLPQEVTTCPRTQAPLYYREQFYGHLGHYHSFDCGGFERPRPQVEARQVRLTPEGASFQVRVDWEAFGDNVAPQNAGLSPEQCAVVLPMPGLFNVYNTLAAITALLDMGVAWQTILTSIADYHGVFGRAETRTIGGKTVRMLLIKNPVGATEVLRVVAADPKARLCVMLNDNYADGRDVSWIWDAAFEWVPKDKPIVAGGTRAHDLALRLKYAGVPETLIHTIPGVKSALAEAVRQCSPGETLYVLPTYTALLALQSF